MTLDEMFQEQRDFSGHWTRFGKLTPKQQEHHAKEYVLKLYKEVSELYEAIHNHQWKGERDQRTSSVPEELRHMQEQNVAVRLEAVDCMKYLINILLCYNTTPTEFQGMFDWKSSINRERLEKRGKDATRKV